MPDREGLENERRRLMGEGGGDRHAEEEHRDAESNWSAATPAISAARRASAGGADRKAAKA
jgi:hypothetical protein